MQYKDYYETTTPAGRRAWHVGGRANAQVNLKQPLPVILFYTTAVAMPDGTIHFAADRSGTAA